MFSILDQPTSPFHEQNLIALFLNRWNDPRLRFDFDSSGNLMIKYRPNSEFDHQAPLGFSAHLDHPGFWAVEMKSTNTLLAHFMGGVPDEYFPGSPVRFWSGGSALPDEIKTIAAYSDEILKLGGKAVDGQVIAIHDRNIEDKPRLIEIEVESEVEPGSIGMWGLPDAELNETRLSARAIDDLAGVCCLAALIEEQCANQSDRPVDYLFTRAEEGGFFGCIEACENRFVECVCIIGLEMSMAQPDTPQGSGPILRTGDRRFMYDPWVCEWMNGIAETIKETDPGFIYHRRRMPGGVCETSVYQAYGLQTGALCLPLGNYHNCDRDQKRIDSEFIDIRDFDRLAQWCYAMIHSDTAIETATDANAFKEKCVERCSLNRHLFTQAVGLSPANDGGDSGESSF